MIINILCLAFGLIGLMYSADKFVKGASNLALNLGVSAILIAIFILGLGTSMPEIIVSSSAALEGSDLALGNVIGSNISNIALIIGITAFFIPITVNQTLIKKEFMLLVGTTGLGVYFLSDGYLSRMDALLFLIGLVFVLYFFISNAKHGNNEAESEELKEPSLSLKHSIVMTIAGLIALVGFSKLLVYGAVELASSLGVSDTVIGLTIVAVGTSLPELSACIAAARQKQEDLVIGNIIGSNIFNVLAVLGISGMITPLKVPQEILVRDLPLMGMLTIGFLLVSFSPKGNAKINRAEGFIFLTIFCVYIVSLVLESVGLFSVTNFLTQ